MVRNPVFETERRLHDLTMVDMFVSLGLAGLVGGLTFQRAPGWWAIVLIGIALVVCVPLGVPRKAANWMRRHRPGSHAVWVVTTPIVMAATLGLYTYMTLFEVRLGYRLEWTQMLLSGSLALCVLWNAGLAVYNFFSLLRARRIA